MNSLIIVLSSILILAGIIGIILPAVPGIPFVFAGLFTYALYTHFTIITLKVLLIFAFLMMGSVILNYSIGIYATKKLGATKFGIYGTIAGVIMGLFFSPFGFISVIILPIIGTIVGEVIGGKKLLDSSKIGLGSLIGYIIGILIDLSIAGAMIYVFVRALF